ncbi:aminotransferase class V-fold PLP-dependent enzyme [Maricaulis parjimensis]|uniref:aminotransferase class V-fold PLP-dependent enzyme n=1 Tax=Maricaulis parjimensis TaxID=144023 RepID=UPI0019393EEC|nr:aminotransferase class V-fold PLP-dependent enzyme [Maricaulis parjimensis]
MPDTAFFHTETTAARALETLRKGLSGTGQTLTTPFGLRPFLYADYTASGRVYEPIEHVMAGLAADYANPHTEDSATGRASNAWMREAEKRIKRAVNAGPQDCLLACASGATGAIHKFQEILGLAVPPASRKALGVAADRRADTVVFLGPYEHHSNELSWRESLAETVSIPLDEEGGIDLAALAAELADPRHAGKRKIGAFSAASNVTGVKSDVRALARLLHAHDAILCLDCAASAPYLPIDVHPSGDPEARIDAVYFSPHKFIGGPGSCGLLLFHAALYDATLPPTQSAGGTVRYVWPDGHDFIEDIEARERAGTPGVPQLVRAALALQLQAEIGHALIARREHAALEAAFEAWQAHPRIEILGPQDPSRRIGIVAFNLRDSHGGVVPPRLVTRLLNDLFGIQSRAGCSCAGPYGHALLGLDEAATQAIRQQVLAGETGARPGWCRVSLHWAMTSKEVQYLIEAVLLLADHAARLASQYVCDAITGGWQHSQDRPETGCFPVSLLCETGSPACAPAKRLDETAIARLREHALEDARALAETLSVGAGI